MNILFLCFIVVMNITIFSPNNKVHGANMGPTWVLPAPDGPHIGPTNPAIRYVFWCPHHQFLSVCLIGNDATILLQAREIANHIASYVVKEPWWRHQMETFSALLALCAGPRWIPRAKASDANFDVFFDLRPNKRLSKQSWGWWFETPSHPLWRHLNAMAFKKWGASNIWRERGERIWMTIS